MISVCYLIICVNLLHSFDQVETFSYYNISGKTCISEQASLIHSITTKNQVEYLAKTVSPYWNLTYAEQLNRKQNSCRVIIDSINNRFGSLKNRTPHKFLQIVPSPVTKAYRNKDVFFILNDIEGNPKTVGFRVGQPSFGRTFSVRPTKIITIKESHKRVAQVFEDFVRLSPLPPHVETNDGGYWRSLLIRSNEAGDIMAVVTIQREGYTNETIQDQQEALKKYFLKHLPNITLYHQQCISKKCTQVTPFFLLFGKPYLLETLNGYKFQISPGSLFQINKLAAEVFYKTIIRMAKLTANTTVLDICSGTGAIGIMASKFVKGVVGIDSDPQAVTDATRNVHLNNIHNVKIILGKAEETLKSVLESLNTSSDIVAIANPGSGGLRMNAIRTIRESPKISRLVYISCKPQGKTTVPNFIDLCSTKRSRSPPFRLTKVIPLDLLPQTEYIEIILILERSLRGNISSQV